MRSKLLEIPALLRTPIGRRKFLLGLYGRAWPLLLPLASLYRKTLVRKTRVAVVVGSFGKTTTTRAVAAALGLRISRHTGWNAGSFLAEGVLRIPARDHHAVLEVGISRKGQMMTNARMIQPDIAVVTSIGSEHHRSLGTLEVTRAEKAEMVRILPAAGLAVLNGDDPNVRWMKGCTRARVITFGFEEANDVQASDAILDWPNGTRFKLHAHGETSSVRTRLIGRHMVYPVLAAVSVALSEGFALDRFLPALEMLPPTQGRLQPIRLANGAFLLLDTYKSHLETIEAALSTLAQIIGAQRIVVLGEVEEPPGSQGPIYGRIGDQVAQVASRVIFVGGRKVFSSFAAGAKRGGLSRDMVVNIGRNPLQAAEMIQADLGRGDVVLIKGRSTQRLERVALVLMGRTVRCDIRLCHVKSGCGDCPMLERGWTGQRNGMWK